MSRNETKMADPEVVPVAQRRQFTAAYKLRILEEAEACTEPGEIGALLRREGLYSSYLTRWRRQRERGELAGLKGKRRGPKPAADKELEEKVNDLRRENKRLKARLAQAEAIIDVQKKVSRLLGMTEETERSGQI
jgi:transposase-like protein